MNPLGIKIVISINASEVTAARAVTYVQEVVSGLTTAGVSAPAVVLAGPISALDKQLDRLLEHNPAFASRVRRLHEGLVGVGFVATLPRSKKDPLPSYISYIDPVTGQNFGNLNSEKFYVMRGDLLAELGALEHFGADRRYAHCHLVSDEAVHAVLAVATREKQ